MSKLITKEDLCKTMLSRWKSYHSNGGTIDDGLRDLGDSPSDEDSDGVFISILGKKSRGWIDKECSECGNYSDSVVMVGDNPDYDSQTAWLCRECLISALELIEGKA